jgi:hypothetical protein
MGYTSADRAGRGELRNDHSGLPFGVVAVVCDIGEDLIYWTVDRDLILYLCHSFHPFIISLKPTISLYNCDGPNVMRLVPRPGWDKLSRLKGHPSWARFLFGLRRLLWSDQCAEHTVDHAFSVTHPSPPEARSRLP